MIPKRFIYPSIGFSQYWEEGMGKTMLGKLNTIPTQNEIETQIPLLFQSDEFADKVIQELYNKLGFKKSNEVINDFLLNGSNEKTPQSLSNLWEEINKYRNEFDLELVNIGAAFCRRSGPNGFIVLRNFCLMGGYESSAINKPLIFTGALKKGAAKRMAETVEFWVDVTGENALLEKHKGFNTTIKVRLMHALARTSILKSGKWKNEDWGVPLNQWDMLATNLGFSLVFIEGLKQLGFNPSPKEINGVFHLWKYIGFLLGIPLHLLPNNETEAIEALFKWTMSQAPADEDTIALAQALMHEPLKASYPVGQWHKKLQVKIHLGYNYFFMKKRACEIMNLPSTTFKYFPYLLVAFNKFNELGIHENENKYKRTEKKGRRRQEKIKDLFLKGHASSLSVYS